MINFVLSGGASGAAIPLVLFFCFVFAVFFYAYVQKQKDDASPKISVRAVVAGTYHPEVRMRGSAHTNSTYFITFETESGETLKFGVASVDYHGVTLGDRGVLTYQGKRYIGFEKA